MKPNYKALLPIGVFLALYLGLGITLEYVLKIPMGFYRVPVVVVFLAALLTACIQNPTLSFEEKLTVMAKGAGSRDIVTMVLIFLTAGVFVGVAGRGGAESVAFFLLSMVPARYAVLSLFAVSAFVSLAMGTSVGTITLLAPIAIAASEGSGFSVPLCLGAVTGGAMFGDNLSFISDTTIAACTGQGCGMKDKFRENFRIAFPAALLTMAVILGKSLTADVSGAVAGSYDLVQIIPYALVLAGGLIGINVFAVLLAGIASGAVITLATGAAAGELVTGASAEADVLAAGASKMGTAAADLLERMGAGVSGMFETSMVAILVAAICALISEYGGFEAVLSLIRRRCRGPKGGKLGMGLLVGIMDIATANNTVAIVMANPIAREMAETYHISPKKAASILDTFSCIFQGILPYGAQLLAAVSIAAQAGCTVSAFDILPNLHYPYMLLLCSLVCIFF